ncbi:hypothetical protein [Aquimarina algicola]|uniref:Uncharacterized protein n=1 Tax=Aquimarina algicola TaxID=2589995 RepID=A0A504J824_9FLAO|nr:hypothetical protein [Aquimarina algicola]TPN87026.1 hypothetical protein FHK87_05390 [Aquimarina algicola]
MKYNLFFNKDQEIIDRLLTDAFGSILGMGLHTSVVNPLPKMIPVSKGVERLQRALLFICENSCEAIIGIHYSSPKAWVS